MTNKRIIIIAGPNGAGKTTFAGEFLPKEANCPLFINADLIAAGLSPFAPEVAAFKAGRLMLQEIHEQYLIQLRDWFLPILMNGQDSVGIAGDAHGTD